MLILAFLLVVVVAKVPLHLNDARDFYHELGDNVIEFMFRTIPLNTKTVEILGQLVADEIHNIQPLYEAACKSTNEDRANTLLNLVKNRKDLEMLLFGTFCLSPAIIKARKNFPNMWPPTGFPLLSHKFSPKNIPTSDIQDILKEALNQPEWWQPSDWLRSVKWHEMNDFSFWRMVPPKYHDAMEGSYIIKTILPIKDQQTFQDLEELLMKSIRISCFYNNLRQGFKEKHFDCDALSYKFAHLHDRWSSRVIDFLKEIYSEKWDRKNLQRGLLRSKLLKVSFWKNGPVDSSTATNDMFELFTVALGKWDLFQEDDGEKKQALWRILKPFLDSIADWSSVRPVVLSNAVWAIDLKFPTFFEKYYDSLLANTNHFLVLQHLPPRHCTISLANKYVRKFGTFSLKDRFLSRGSNRPYYLPPYTKLLYQEWTRDRINWPGMMTVHEKIKGHFCRVFEQNKHGTYDPKTDQDYDVNTWKLAFNAVKFEVQHGIPTSFVPSKCFLQALVYYNKKRFVNNVIPLLPDIKHTPINWAALKEEIGEKIREGCILPKRKDEQDRYENVLAVACGLFFSTNPPFPRENAEMLESVIRENQKTNELTKKLQVLTIQ